MLMRHDLWLTTQVAPLMSIASKAALGQQATTPLFSLPVGHMCRCVAQLCHFPLLWVTRSQSIPETLIIVFQFVFDPFSWSTEVLGDKYIKGHTHILSPPKIKTCPKYSSQPSHMSIFPNVESIYTQGLGHNPERQPYMQSSRILESQIKILQV